MACKKCNSENVQVQRVSVTKRKKKGISYWLFGWFIDFMLWLFLTFPRLLVAIFAPKKTKTNGRCDDLDFKKAIIIIKQNLEDSKELRHNEELSKAIEVIEDAYMQGFSDSEGDIHEYADAIWERQHE